MNAPPEYLLGKDASLPTVIEALRNMARDAETAAVAPALFFAQFKVTDNKAATMYYLGQMDVLKSLVWALDGTAEEDGLDPTAQIATEDGIS